MTEQRKELKQKINQCQDSHEKKGMQAKYAEANRQIKKTKKQNGGEARLRALTHNILVGY